jgi:hypothetical protein
MATPPAAPRTTTKKIIMLRVNTSLCTIFIIIYCIGISKFSPKNQKKPQIYSIIWILIQELRNLGIEGLIPKFLNSSIPQSVYLINQFENLCTLLFCL